MTSSQLPVSIEPCPSVLWFPTAKEVYDSQMSKVRSLDALHSAPEFNLSLKDGIWKVIKLKLDKLAKELPIGHDGTPTKMTLSMSYIIRELGYSEGKWWCGEGIADKPEMRTRLVVNLIELAIIPMLREKGFTARLERRFKDYDANLNKVFEQCLVISIPRKREN